MLSWSRILLSMLFVVLTSHSAAAQDCTLPREHHPWARYHVGSWKEVRVTTESLGADGNVINTSVTDTKTTLHSVTSSGVVLNVQVVVQVDGKEFASPSQNVWNGFYGQQENQRVTIRRVGQQTIPCNGQNHPCEQRQITFDGVRGRSTTVCYSPKCSPYVLRRETVSGEGEGMQVRSVAEVTSVQQRIDVFGTEHIGSTMKTTVTQSKGTRITNETVCDDVPGGVVEHSSQEFDENGRLVRRSKLELLAYEIHEPQAGSDTIRHRRFNRRERR